jgi:hypothetical protein
MQPLMYRSSTSAVWADALFASTLQRSDGPSVGQVRKAVAAAMRVYGGRGCAERVAQEFGDHPETAITRMRWARGVVGEVFASPPGLRETVAEYGKDYAVRACAEGGW